MQHGVGADLICARVGGSDQHFFYVHGAESSQSVAVRFRGRGKHNLRAVLPCSFDSCTHSIALAGQQKPRWCFCTCT